MRARSGLAWWIFAAALGCTSAPSSGGDAGAAPVDARRARDVALPDGGGLVRYTEPRAPCARRNPLRDAYFGDLHAHTAYSFDAWAGGARADPAAAYRFARGEPLDLGGRAVRIDRPLDFAAVTDHAEFLGETLVCTEPGAPGYDSETCRTFRERPTVGFQTIGARLVLGGTPGRRDSLCGAGGRDCLVRADRVWRAVQGAADAAYDRTDACRFTAFVAYEYTNTSGGAMLHRNVIFRNEVVPAMPITFIEEPTPEGLWGALRAQCLDADSGCDALAIPHNSNFSNGRMFAVEAPAGTGGGATAEARRARAALRARLEPLVEIYQHKGASECALRSRVMGLFGSTDEQCAFEDARTTLRPCGVPAPDAGVGDDPDGGRRIGLPGCVARTDGVREALLDGLREARAAGVNPLRLGIVASTDTHNGTPGAVAEGPGDGADAGFAGHVGAADDTPAERLDAENRVFSPGGLAGVWAVENSRDALFEALARREVFGTSGPRIAVRFYAGYGLGADLCAAPDAVARADREGVPMGATLPPRPPGTTGGPRFFALALADRAPLERVEVVKGWVDAAGAAHERVVAVAGGPDPGATVDPATCATTPGRGRMTLCAAWDDPDFDPAAHTFYYVRVLENPTCRATAWACLALPPPARAAEPVCRCGALSPAAREADAACRAMPPAAVQERAWTSPVWYAPP